MGKYCNRAERKALYRLKYRSKVQLVLVSNVFKVLKPNMCDYGAPSRVAIAEWVRACLLSSLSFSSSFSDAHATLRIGWQSIITILHNYVSPVSAMLLQGSASALYTEGFVVWNHQWEDILHQVEYWLVTDSFHSTKHGSVLWTRFVVQDHCWEHLN